MEKQVSENGPCTELRRDIGMVLDHEASSSVRDRVQQHLRQCESCCRFRDELIEVRRAVAEMEVEEPPSVRLWERIDRQLHPEAEQPAGFRRLPVAGIRAWAVAATILLALLLGYGYARLAPSLSAPAPVPPPIALTVGDYVREATVGAPQAFWSRYSALETSVESALERLDFQPWMPRELPGGYRLESVRLLADVCCNTLQMRYASDDGVLDVFQCHDDHPVTYGRARTRRGRHAGVAYTDLEWDGSPLRGRAFSSDDLNVILVGGIDSGLADRIVEAMSRQDGRSAAFERRPLPAEHTGVELDGTPSEGGDPRKYVGALPDLQERVKADVRALLREHTRPR